MPTVVKVLATYDYKYELALWRADIEEFFQKTKQVTTSYTVVDGQILATVETTWEFADAIAAKSPQLPDPPTTFLFVDGTYRKDAAFVFQKTHIKTTTYEAYGETAYLVTIEDYNVLTRELTRTVSIVDGKIPLAPTVNSALTNLILQPITIVLEDNCDFIDSRMTIDNQWLESEEDGSTVARRALQRETAIVRRLKHAANPMMRVGDTVRIVDDKRGLDARHIVTRRTITLDENGAADQVTESEFWTR
jgi:hypothetical protein